jgi:hypothetical protein
MTQSTERPRPAWYRVGPDVNMRVSDAERAEVADRLGRHFADGRLDQAEFDERVSRAMAAKTVADFQGLFNDLPNLPGDLPGGVPAGPGIAPGMMPPAAGYMAMRQRGPLRGPVRVVLFAALVLLAANVAWHAFFWMIPLMWVAVIATIVVVASRRARHSSS